jgi:hypothetical protein
LIILPKKRKLTTRRNGERNRRKRLMINQKRKEGKKDCGQNEKNNKLEFCRIRPKKQTVDKKAIRECRLFIWTDEVIRISYASYNGPARL